MPQPTATASERADSPVQARGTGPHASCRVLLFTDTLGDVNGVSRFIRDAAGCALSVGRDLTVLTSTRFELPQAPNIVNADPILAVQMPRYENLELVWPPARKMLRFAADFRPTAIHVSTPGPVGMVGRVAARRLRVPLLGTYHTDFPAYIERLFELEALTWLSRSTMSNFYRPFDVVFTRSQEYREAVQSLGVPPDRLETLRPGFRTDLFQPRFRDPSIWQRLTPGDAAPDTLRFLSVGRVSVEKNLPFLARAWRQADAILRSRSVAGSLIVVGDGPYRERMQAELAGTRTHFLGFKHGQELSTLYASSDLFLFPSTTDTLGQVVLEAQCSGVPVLVTDQGGPRSVIQDGVTGNVLTAESPKPWVDAIVALALDPHKRRAMGNAAQAHASTMTIDNSIDHFWSIHERLSLSNQSRIATGRTAGR